MEHLGIRIRKLRKERKDSLKDLAEKIEYDWSNLSKVERGIYGASIDLLKRITEVYGLSPAYFFGEEFTTSEGNLLLEDENNLSVSKIKEKYNLEDVDGEEASEEEIREAIRLIRLLRKSQQQD